MTERDPLDDRAAEIAAEHFLKGRSLRELARVYSASASTLQRRLAGWNNEGRFEILDRRLTAARAVGRDERLEEELARRTQVWRARVARIEGVDRAFTDEYLLDPSTPGATAAFRAGDELHRTLGFAAAEVFLNSLKRHATVGLASGRGVGFTVAAVEELSRRHPSWIRGFESMRLESLCGGGHVGTWVTPIGRDLDADQNVFVLAGILGIGKSNVDFMGGWIASQEGWTRRGQAGQIDLALVGFGQLNSRHHFLHHYQGVQLGNMAGPLAKIRALQAKCPDLASAIAELAHRVFVVGPGPFPRELQGAVRQINEAVFAAKPERLATAGEVILVAGGTQKVTGLAWLLKGGCPDAPIDLSRTTLVTDDRTAEGILAAPV